MLSTKYKKVLIISRECQFPQRFRIFKNVLKMQNWWIFTVRGSTSPGLIKDVKSSSLKGR